MKETSLFRPCVPVYLQSRETVLETNPVILSIPDQREFFLTLEEWPLDWTMDVYLETGLKIAMQCMVTYNYSKVHVDFQPSGREHSLPTQYLVASCRVHCAVGK